MDSKSWILGTAQDKVLHAIQFRTSLPMCKVEPPKISVFSGKQISPPGLAQELNPQKQRLSLGRHVRQPLPPQPAHFTVQG